MRVGLPDMAVGGNKVDCVHEWLQVIAVVSLASVQYMGIGVVYTVHIMSVACGIILCLEIKLECLIFSIVGKFQSVCVHAMISTCVRNYVGSGSYPVPLLFSFFPLCSISAAGCFSLLQGLTFVFEMTLCVCVHICLCMLKHASCILYVWSLCCYISTRHLKPTGV